MCYCNCTGTGHSGPVCNSTAPQHVSCATDATLVSVAVASSENDRYLKIRMCASPDHSCSGTAPSGSSKAYADCAEYLPPRQAATLSIPENTTVLVFVDKHCPNRDFEVWRPLAGWVSQNPIRVPSQCHGGAPPLPLEASSFPVSFPFGCGSESNFDVKYFPERLCDEEGLKYKWGVCQYTDPGQGPRSFTWEYQAGVLRQCTCLLYTSDAADEEDSVDLGGRRIIKKKKEKQK
eukprot:TRINITY_DN26346_c0_g1_i2.p1 TRINITY_DN26346_c0_g1~~TRINITY_DN26346_c0_g1_i2.p1  ORF type:complete len:234 (-),score=29.10 TRINITY_DN26346_c0_g1_i2:44-745(-)